MFCTRKNVGRRRKENPLKNIRTVFINVLKQHCRRAKSQLTTTRQLLSNTNGTNSFKSITPLRIDNEIPSSNGFQTSRKQEIVLHQLPVSNCMTWPFGCPISISAICIFNTFKMCKRNDIYSALSRPFTVENYYYYINYNVNNIILNNIINIIYITCGLC